MNRIVLFISYVFESLKKSELKLIFSKRFIKQPAANVGH